MFCGIIDWDGVNMIEDGLFVIRRWELENYMFDPLLIFSVLLAQGVGVEKMGGRLKALGKSDAYRIGRFQADVLQEIVDWIDVQLAADYSDDSRERVQAMYLRADQEAVSLLVPRYMIATKGKDLEKNIYKAFGGDKINQRKLLDALHHVDIVPGDLRDIFDDIANSFSSRRA